MLFITRLCCVITFASILFFGFQSCNKNKDFIPGDFVTPTLNLNIEGIVTGTDGKAMANVIIHAGSAQTVTDANGNFRISKANFASNQTFVTATRAGYFKGSRTFFASENSNNFLRIQLIQKKEVAIINAASGGVATVDGNTITFQPNSFVLASGASYSGSVSVKAAYIDPTNEAMYERMPGDLRGITTGNISRGLKSFGMINVELESSTGEKLQLKSGTTAVLSMAIPASLLATASIAIPLWHFEETTGLWREEGFATRVGNNYVGTVSHFTFWNVDIPFAYWHLRMKIVNASSQPLSRLKVKLTNPADQTTVVDFTDNNGIISGFVPKDQQLLREIFDECNNVISSAVIGPITKDSDLGNVLVTLNSQTISGTVLNCNNQPVADGVVTMSIPGRTWNVPVVNGNFTSTFSRCNATSAILVAVDNENHQQGPAASVNFISSSITTAPLPACGSSVTSFISISTNSITKTWTGPFWFAGGEDTVIGFKFLFAGVIDTFQSPNLNNYNAVVRLEAIPGSTLPGLVNFRPSPLFVPPTNNAPTLMHGDYFPLSITSAPVFTEYGAIGQFVAGNFAGRFRRTWGTVTDTVDVTCSFRVPRTR